MKYLILTIPSVDYAKAISKFLYALSVPTLDQVTQYYNGYIIHPNTGKVALGFPDEDIYVHSEADEKALVDQVRNAISEEEATQLEQDIIDNKGQRAIPIDFIPQSLKSNLKTYAQMENWGWFELEEDLI